MSNRPNSHRPIRYRSLFFLYHLVYPLFLLLLSSLLPTALAQQPRVEVEITGAAGAVLDNVRNNLSLYLQRNHPLLNEMLIRRLHQKAPDEIRTALQPFGFYRPAIHSTLDLRDGIWIARYDIDPGDPIRIAALNVAITGPGADDPALTRWRDRYPLHEGGVLDQKVYEDEKQKLLQLGRERGYFDGRLVDHRIIVSLDPYQASIHVEYATGPRYRFGAIDFEQHEFDEGFLRRYLTFHTGDPYDASKILAFRRTLADSDYFERADVMTLSEQAHDEQVPIRVVIVAKKHSRYLAGVGYSTDTGVRGKLGYENRLANKYGHRYSLMLRDSEIEKSFTARYAVPLRKPATDSLAYSYSRVDERTTTVNSVTGLLDASLTQQLGQWLRTAGLSFEHEHYRVDQTNDAKLLMPHVRWQRVKARDRIFPRNGWMLALDTRGAADSILSSTSFLQGRADGKLIISLTERSRLLLRGTAGASWTPEFALLPPSQRFFAGGDNSIRGFAYNSLGPKSSDGTVIGGHNILVGSSELEMDTGEHTAMAFFIDAGNAFDDVSINVQKGTGFGFRWRTPIGAIRLDLAQALSAPGRPWRIHLTLGPDL
jgi:translocation and assembly module TamA